MNRGYAVILTGYIGWGLFPLYWALLTHVPPGEVLLHRMLWAVPVLVLLVALSLKLVLSSKTSPFTKSVSHPHTPTLEIKTLSGPARAVHAAAASDHPAAVSFPHLSLRTCYSGLMFLGALSCSSYHNCVLYTSLF